MTENISVEWSTKDQEIIKSLGKVTDGFEKVIDRLNKIDKTTKQTHASFKQQASSVDLMIGKVGQLAASFSAVSAATKLARDEWDKMVKSEGRAKEANVSFGEAIRGLRLNFQADETLAADDLEASVLKLAKDTKSDPTKITAGLGEAFSSKGALTNKQAVEAYGNALNLTGGDVNSAKELAGRTMDIMNRSSEKDSRVILGFLQKGALASRQSSLEQYGQTAVPAMLALNMNGRKLGQGDTLDQAAAIFTTISANDKTGKQSETAVVSLSKQLRDFVPKAIGSDERGKFSVPQAQIDAYNKATKPSEWIGVLQRSPELRRQFMSGASFEASAQPSIEGFLSGDKKIMELYAAAQKNIGKFDKSSGAAYDSKVSEVRAGTHDPFIELEREKKTNVLVNELVNRQKESIRGQVRETIQQTLDGLDFMGPDAITHAVTKTRFNAKVMGGADPVQAGKETLDSLGQYKQFGSAVSPRYANEGERDFINKQTEALDKLQKSMERLNQLLEDSAKDKPQKVEIQNAPNKLQTSTSRPSMALNRSYA